MAARSHVDGGVNERRLRPVYDCLDNGNNKKALQEAEKVLKKQKDFQCAKVLKSLALLRLGRHEESKKLLRDVHDEVPTDDATLQAITICYRELHQLDLIAEAYEAAAQKEPQNEELLTHLFMAYVRLGEYKEQHRVAMSLYKLKPKNPYYFWAVMSIVMQAHTAVDEVVRNMLLQLAERMTEKFAQQNRLEAEAEVQLYLLILEQEQKWEEALQVLSGPLAAKMTSFLNFKPVKRAELLRKLEKWQEVNSAYKDLIATNPDNWSFYGEYMDSTLKLIEVGKQSSGVQSELNFIEAIQAARDFIVSLVEAEKTKEGGHALRGPFLAHIKLTTICLESKYECKDSLIDLLKDYFQRFGSKACCFNDLNMFLSFINESEKSMLLDSAKETLAIVSEDSEAIQFPDDVSQMQQHLGYVQLCHRLGVHDRLKFSERHKLVSELLHRYHHASKFGADLLPTDVQPNDGYCVLASHILFDIWVGTGDVGTLDLLLVTLEAALINSPSNHQIKLLLIKLYNSIGAVGRCYDLYDSMDIKHILQDALGYIVAPCLVARGHFSQGNTVYGNMLKFFGANYKDTVDYLIASYKFGSFTKIQEFVAFRERLNNSMQYVSAAVERMIQDLILETDDIRSTEQMIVYMEIDPELDKTLWADLKDNRDLNIMVSWASPEMQVSASTKQISFEAEVTWMKMRNLMIRCLAAAHMISRGGTCCGGNHERCDSSVKKKTTTTGDNCLVTNNDVKRLPHDVLGDLVRQFRVLLETNKAHTYKMNEAIIQDPPESRLVVHLKGSYTIPVVNLFDVLLTLSELQVNKCSENDKVSPEIFRKESTDIVKDCILQVTNNLKVEALGNLKTVGNTLEELVNVAEMISFLVAILGCCRRILQPHIQYGVKKGRKRKETSHMMTIAIDAYREYLNVLENSITNLYQSIQDVRMETITSQLRITDQSLALPDSDVLMISVAMKIEKSYQQSLSEISALLWNKLKYMSWLQL